MGLSNWRKNSIEPKGMLVIGDSWNLESSICPSLEFRKASSRLKRETFSMSISVRMPVSVGELRTMIGDDGLRLNWVPLLLPVKSEFRLWTNWKSRSNAVRPVVALHSVEKSWRFRSNLQSESLKVTKWRLLLKFIGVVGTHWHSLAFGSNWKAKSSQTPILLPAKTMPHRAILGSHDC